MDDIHYPSPDLRARWREIRLAAVAGRRVRPHCVFAAVCTVFALALLGQAVATLLLLVWGVLTFSLIVAAYAVGDDVGRNDAAGVLGRRDLGAACQGAIALAFGLVGFRVCDAGTVTDGAALAVLSIALGISYLSVGAASLRHSMAFLLLSLVPPSYQCLTHPEIDMQRLGCVLAVALTALLIAGWSYHRSLVRLVEIENDNREMAQTLRYLHPRIRDDAP
jgi:hypothetical protein